MGRISGWLWIVAACVGVAGAFLPGAEHQGLPWVIGLSAFVFLYGIGSVTGWIPWDRASINALATGMALTIPVVGLGLYLSGGSLSYIEPLLVCSLLYAAFFFPARWAWPLSIELVLVAGTPLLYDGHAVENAYPSRYLALAAGYLAATAVMVGLKRRLVDAEARQRDFAHRDPLTGIGNRRHFDSTLKRELSVRTHPRRGRREGEPTPLAVFILDLDDFKGVNDRHGHQVGDAVLVEAAARVHSMLRSTDTLARIGGDEFAVIAPGAHGEGVRRMADSIRNAVGIRAPGAKGPTPSASIGWAVFPEDGEDYETLIRTADERMLRLKQNGSPFALGRQRQQVG
ncbi:MAG TPA: GGDEF domain-containing protein [Solirubrobacterales bacterium]|nr:GGDEF domain-containing protein [Solirubrobacterales bacterium]